MAATAQVLVQRFYCKRSLKRFDVKVRRRWSGGGVGVALCAAMRCAHGFE